MRLHVICIGIMNIIGGNQRNVQFSADLQQFGIHHPLFRQTVILQLQKIIALSKAVSVFDCCLFCFLRQTLLDIPCHLSGEAGRQCNNPLMKFPKDLHIHTGLVIVPLRKASADDLHQVCITGIIFRKQNQMVISVLPAGQFLVKPGVCCHINLTAQDRSDPLCLACFIKIDHAIHDAVICDSSTVHAELLHPLHIFFYLVGTV